LVLNISDTEKSRMLAAAANTAARDARGSDALEPPLGLEE
jgi:hypothetical protein